MTPRITQSDLVTAYGWGIDALWDGLLSGQTGIGATDRFAGRDFVSNQAASVPGLSVESGQSRAMAMLSRLLWPLIGQLEPKTPIILATTVGEIDYLEQRVLKDDDRSLAEASPSTLLARLQQLLGLTGSGITLSCACASSAAALARAGSMIRHGHADRVLVVAADAVSEFVYSGFSTLLSLCESPARPFDANRSGLTLGEAAGWAVVASRGRGIELLGWGHTTDAVHMTAPDRFARGLSRAISKACAMAGRAPAEIAFIAAHGTATRYSDAMEMTAFREVIGSPRPTFSIKGGIGHTLAAAGLAQVLVAARGLERGIVPPTVGLQSPDADATGWVFGESRDVPGATVALSTNAGFGGVNAALLLGRGGA